jgi:hypothetical protein
MRTIVVMAAMMLMGCSKPDVASQAYKFENGQTAFIVDRYKYGFGVRGPDTGGSASLDVLKVSQCKGGQLWWDRGQALVFRYDAAEISYLADVGGPSNSLSIAACRNSNVLCMSSTPSASVARIPITCG